MHEWMCVDAGRNVQMQACKYGRQFILVEMYSSLFKNYSYKRIFALNYLPGGNVFFCGLLMDDLNIHHFEGNKGKKLDYRM